MTKGIVKVTRMGKTVKGNEISPKTPNQTSTSPEDTGFRFFSGRLDPHRQVWQHASMTLPKDASKRKTFPLATGFLDYFPDAVVAIAHVSFQGNEQHNPGTPLHWDRGKSMDQADTMLRHFMERGELDSDGLRHSAKMAWRALAILQLEIEQETQE